MDFSKYRDTGELSDIEICVNDHDSTIVLENFPGGSKIFSLVADYCYNKEICLNSDNVIEVRCAVEYLQMHGATTKSGLATIAEDILYELFFLAKAKRDYKLILLLIEKAEKYREFIEQTELHVKLMNEFAINFLSSVKIKTAYDYTIDDRFKLKYLSVDIQSMFDDAELNTLNRLPLEWLVILIKIKARNILYQSFIEFLIISYINANTTLCQTYKLQFKHNEHLEDVLKIIFEHSIGKIEINANEQQASEQQENSEELKPSKESLETIEIIKAILIAFDEMYTETRFPLTWLFACMNELHVCKEDEKFKLIIVKWIWESLNNLNKNSDEINKIPVDVMAQLISLKVLSLKDNTNFDYYSVSRLIELSDYYICVLQSNDKLTVDLFTKIATCVPKTYRDSFDNLMNALLKLIKNDLVGGEQLNDLLGLIDFQKLSEKTLEECKNCERIPQSYVTEAALALCAKLRDELNKQKTASETVLNTPIHHYETYTPTSSYKLHDINYSNSYRLKYPTPIKLSVPLSRLNVPSHDYLSTQREIERRRLLQTYEAVKKQHHENSTILIETPRCTSSNSYHNTSDDSTSYTNSDYSRYSSRHTPKSNDLNDLNDVYSFYTPVSARSTKSNYAYRY